MAVTDLSFMRRPARLRGTRLLLAALLVPAALATGCASSGKLAQRSGQQLAEGDVQKAWFTALKAIEKDPYNARALSALSASGQALLNHEARRFRGLAPMDPAAAADVSLGMDELRHRVAGYGALLASDAVLVAEEKRVRAGVAATHAADGEAQLEAGRPKDAYAAFERARHYDDSDPKLAVRMQKAHDTAVDRVLIMPYAIDTRAPLDVRGLSDAMFVSVRDFAAERLTFTTLADPGLVWNRLLRSGRAEASREAAFAVAEERSATRVAWSRIHGDRIESHSETFIDVVYRRIHLRRPDGSTIVRWDEVPVLVRVEDRWVSLEVECEVHDVAEERVVARRATDYGAGLRIIHTLTPFPGDAADYALYTPDMWSANREACRRRTSTWEAAFGSLSVEGLAGYARKSAKTTVGPRSTRHGVAVRLGRNYGVSYGILPGEATLLESALADAWKEVAAALEEADKS